MEKINQNVRSKKKKKQNRKYKYKNYVSNSYRSIQKEKRKNSTTLTRKKNDRKKIEQTLQNI